ncbi:alpha/beta-hydrolase [Trichoderma barbatum]
MAVVSSPLKPHILIIPGAWHPGSVMAMFIKSLEAAGFSAEALSLRSVGTAGVSVQDDEAQVKAVLTPLIDEGRDVILFAHSYGGIVTEGVVSNPSLDKWSREAQGLKGGVVGVVYLASLLSLQDESVFQLSGGKWWDNIDVERTETEGLVYTLSQVDTFYHDCSSELASSIVATLKPHSVEAIKTAPSAVRWQDKVYDGRRAYIRCLQDKALPVEIQDHFIARTEVEWLVKTVDSSHSPFLSMPAKLTGVLQEIIEEFAKK